MKYRKKPVVIEAVQWHATQESWDAVLALGLEEWRPGETDSDSFYVCTLEGDHKATKGDYIIQGIQGEIYPCKPDIFEATYEPVEHGA